MTADLNNLASESSVAVPIAPIPFEIELKERRLRDLFQELGSVLVAFSGGVDSSYVAYIATSVLGANALCVTGRSPSLARNDLDDLVALAGEFGFHHRIIQTNELDNPEYQANSSRRCYFCKSELYSKLKPVADAAGLAFVVDGSTTDDLGDYRPGRAAAAEHSTRSPLIEVAMSKQEVRLLSKRAGLPTWDKPASPCLSSRIAYGTAVTIERLSDVERGEAIMRSLGFREFRVRHHDGLVRLEIAPAELDKALSRAMIEELAKRFRLLGFQYVTLDLHGYRSGSMNEVLSASIQ
ncbi:MAG: pyridinium-3,5-biscarboxylic acid mononucleotide sulfurtransferase [Blastocatellia bacterium]|nr:pyridinium-3,5-biscarboxylic acid mononucleotide sulfurtransferase [Blastocatellia bacterium]